MKKFWAALSAVLLISACSDKQEETTQAQTEQQLEAGEQVVAKPQFDIQFEDIVYNYESGNLPQGCDKGSDIVCAIDMQVKCTIDHKLAECDPKKLPKFTFIEVYTKSDCNGVWFGLCKGNIVYVLSNKSGSWAVKDLYALQSI